MTDFIFLGSKITVDGECSHEIKTLTPRKESYNELRQCIKKQRYHFANKRLCSQSYGFSSGHVWMWELDHKKDGTPKGWAPKNWCFQIVDVGEDAWESLGLKGDQSSQSERKSTLIFIGRTDVEGLASWCEELTHWKKPLCWERLKAKGEGGNRGWDGWIASLIQLTWFTLIYP